MLIASLKFIDNKCQHGLVASQNLTKNSVFDLKNWTDRFDTLPSRLSRPLSRLYDEDHKLVLPLHQPRRLLGP